MNPIRLLAQIIGLSLLLVFAAAGAAARPALASVASQGQTPAPTATRTPTPAVSAVGSITLTVTIPISTTLLVLDDLPPSFRLPSESQLATLNRAYVDPAAAALTSRVHYVGADGRTLLTQRVVYPLSPGDQWNVVMALTSAHALDPQKLADAYFMGSAGGVTDAAFIPSAENVGDLSFGVTFVTQPSAGATNRHDGILMLRDDVFVEILLTYTEGSSPGTTVLELAQLTDRRIVTAQEKARAALTQPPAEWRLLANDAFDVESSRWCTGDTQDEYSKTSRNIQDGKYVWQVRADKSVTDRCAPASRPLSDFIVSVQVRRVSGTPGAEYGLVFVDESSNYIFFDVGDDQRFQIFLRSQGKWETLVRETTATAIRPGETNRLGVKRQGSQFTFFINDRMVSQVVNDKLPAGRPGVAISLFEGDAAAYEFDDFQVHGVPSYLELPGLEPISLDPAVASDANSSDYLVEIFSGLVTLDRNLIVVPDLAERWEVSGNGTVYTFHLRSNAKFQDGRPVTAQDIQYSLERAADPRTHSSTASVYLGDIVGVTDKLAGKAPNVRGIEVIDDRTIRLTIDAPKSYFLAKLTRPTAFVLDRNNVEGLGSSWTGKPNGTGPYRLKEYTPKNRLILARNDLYYLEPKPQIPQVRFKLAGGGTPYITQYDNGDLDAAPVTGSNVALVLDPNNPHYKESVLVPPLSMDYIVFNARTPPFDDPKVRQAFALAIDRQSILDRFYTKLDLPAKSILPQGMPGYNAALPEIEYNPEHARQLLSESKYAREFPKIVWGQVGTGKRVPAIVEMLKTNLGVNITIEQTDWATLLTKVGRADNPYNMFTYGWAADYPDPENYIAVLFQSSGAQNVSGYADPQVDQWIVRAAVELDPNGRVLLYQQAEARILQDRAVLPLKQSRELWLVKPNVTNLDFPAITLPRLRFAALK